MPRKRNLHKNNVARRFAKSKLQSAMEYLMTYGWAILIIAVVLGALFQLGVFNANNFAPKAPPGACQVFRPNGPGTTSFINLEGICTGELPQSTAYFGNNGYINITGGILPCGPIPQITVTAWEKQLPGGITPALLNMFSLNTVFFNVLPHELQFYTINDNWIGATTINLPSVSVDALDGNWHFIAFSINVPANTIIGYVDSDNSSSGISQSAQACAPTTVIGGASTGFAPSGLWPGRNLANIQVYNTSLSPKEIKTLYLEGIGGAPIDLQNLVAWWPLNGNANDYSGNGNNGQIVGNVIFVSNWWSGYTPP